MDRFWRWGDNTNGSKKRTALLLISIVAVIFLAGYGNPAKEIVGWLTFGRLISIGLLWGNILMFMKQM